MSRSSNNNISHPTRPLDNLPISIKKAAKLKGSPSPSRLSPKLGSKHRSSHHRPFKQCSQHGTASPRLSVFSDEEGTPSSSNDSDDFDDEDISATAAYHHHTHLPGIKLPIPTRSMQAPPKHQRAPHKKASKAGAKKERVRRERKATVRKQRFDELESDSDLTDIPSSDDDDAIAAIAAASSGSGLRPDKGKGKSSDLSLSDSDTEMEKKLLEAGDGESLLGSDGEENEQDEERFIIRDAMKEARARIKVRRDKAGGLARSSHNWSSRGDTKHRARSSTISRPSNSAEGGAGGDAADAEAEADADLLSLSPDAMRLYGLPYVEDEIFEEQEGFRTSSEPSFTDFFETSTDSETAPGDGPRDDDDEFTTDSDTDEDISDLESGVLEAPLIAHIGTAQQLGGSVQQADPAAGAELAAQQPDVPLLVIEDLDGRLIYARAGDGEAVFGSDGEFEFVDDTDDDSTDCGYDEHGNCAWPSWGSSMGMLGAPEDDGDTTDELPDEDMPYPRLLVGSVAPRGGRNSRRARALAAKSRMLSPASGLQSGLPSPSAKEAADLLALQGLPKGSAGSSTATRTGITPAGSASASSEESALEVDLTISTEDLARDPEGTLQAAAEALGLTLEEAANLIAGVQLPPSIGDAVGSGGSIDSGNAADAVPSQDLQVSNASAAASSSQPPRTPDVPRSANFVKPEMGSFMPTSSKSVHRAVIDGSRKAPSPFSGKRSLQKKGLAKKRSATRGSSMTDQLSKRQRRFSSVNDGASTIEELSEVAASSPEQEQVDPMDLDDVVDADMLWRGHSSKSPSPETYGDSATETEGTVSLRSAAVAAATQSNGRPGLNLNAFARWDKIPMGTFRDSQRASSAFGQTQHQQPLGTFLLTRSQGRSQRRYDHSPFRTPSAAAGDLEMFSMSPIRPQHPSSTSGDPLDPGQGGGRRRPFVISPVLFPTRSGDIAKADGRSSISSHGAFPLERHTSMPQGRLGGSSVASSVQPALSNSAGPGRITRREKKERKARRAALLAAGADHDDARSVMSAQSEPSHSPHVSTPQLPDVVLQSLRGKDRSDSPATALPRMRITDASPTPRASPAPTPAPIGTAATPSAATTTYASIAGGMGPPLGSTDKKVAVGNGSSSHLDEGQGDDATDGKADGLLSASGGLPSSACKTPLHSPLFGGIFGTMVDDLDDRDGENALSI